MAYKLNGKVINGSFTHNGNQYPSNWLALSTQAEKDAIGIVWENEADREDDFYYHNGDINTPKALDDVNQTDEDGNQLYEPDGTTPVINKGLKTLCEESIKKTSHTLLSKTDWYVTRKYEQNVVIPDDITAKRTALRNESNRLQAAIQAATNVEELITAMNSQDWNE